MKDQSDIESTKKDDKQRAIFDYRALRLLMGFIALALPLVVSLVSRERLSSISASYYTNARDVFVGMLCVVSAFLLAYNGHWLRESIASKVASVAAVCVAVFPTSPAGGGYSMTSWVHFGSATVLFSTLAYFCLGPFRKNTKGQSGKKGVRSKVYLVCGSTMIACMAVMLAAISFLSREVITTWRIIYWGEATALVAFGAAWIVAGKYFGWLVDEKQKLLLSEIIGGNPSKDQAAQNQ
ncbi:MAG: hypothetical protein QGG42_01600 [Phycisphaerae bacterium]|nr:hypothetical protein [Phycisphaerae bacterium]